MFKLICGNEPIYQQKNLHMKQYGTGGRLHGNFEGLDNGVLAMSLLQTWLFTVKAIALHSYNR